MKTINLSRGNIIQPIEWKQYEGETVIVKTIIRKGERIRETEFFPDKVKAVPRGNAYCIKKLDKHMVATPCTETSCLTLYFLLTQK